MSIFVYEIHSSWLLQLLALIFVLLLGRSGVEDISAQSTDHHKQRWTSWKTRKQQLVNDGVFKRLS
jgi:hypothetical protein